MNFLQPTDTNTETNNFITSTESISINGTSLEMTVTGFRTISVGGRELRSRNLTVDRISGRDGTLLRDSLLEPRDLDIEYMLQADSASDFRDKFNLLNSILQNKELIVTFADEPEYYYKGVFNKATSVPRGRNSIVSSFIIYCADPYKYKILTPLTGVNITIPESSTFPYAIKELKVIISSTRTNFTISNQTTGRSIILLGEFKAGDILQIKNDRIYLNNQDIMNRLDFVNTDWKNFTLSKKDKISCGQTMTLTLLERAL